MANETELAQKNIELSFEFSRYLLTNPDVEKKIPDNALIVFDIANDAALTKFNAALAKRTKEADQPVVVVHIKRLAPSRLVEPEVTLTT